MARTKGHGNPAWNRDETILALNLYLQFPGKLPAAKHPAVRALSETLRALPYHVEASKNATFRNLASVSFKLQNIKQVATGEGLANVSRTDRQVWEEFYQRPDQVFHLAEKIRSAVETSGSSRDDGDEEIEFFEGRLLTSLHLKRERSGRLRKALIDSKRPTGLRCEVCELSRADLSLDHQEALFEAHHILPLSATQARNTKLSDMALLCANCHRLTHYLIAKHRRWLTMREVHELLIAPLVS